MTVEEINRQKVALVIGQSVVARILLETEVESLKQELAKASERKSATDDQA